jgi:putative ABC transport system substrate-binding protein
LVASAQQVGKVSRIGYLRQTSLQPADIAELRLGLRELGHVEGQNLIIDERYANGDASRLPVLARELLQLKVQVLVVDGGATLAAVREIVGATPIVFAVVGNPVNAGFVKSLGRPGGTMTGLTNFSGELVPKRLQLLHEILPAKRVGVLSNPVNPSPLGHERLRAVARSLEIELTFAEAQTAGELAAAIAKLSQAGVGALLVIADGMFFTERARIVDLAASYRLPAAYPEREYVEAGGLMSYGPNLSNNFRRAAAYVDKILKGAKPADLPVEQPTKFELAINLKAAKALGIALPQSLLLRADEVIQ